MNKYKASTLFLCATWAIFFISCNRNNEMIPIPMTAQFEQKLTAYNIYEGDLKELIPSPDFHLVDIQSPLFSNYTEKQRLVKVPDGAQITENGNGIPIFPEGTILVKTFFYFNDERDEDLGKQIIETRLLIKSQGSWNVASYVWDESQTEATLAVDGLDTQVSWINASGTNRSIPYHVPNQEECVSCHQQNAEVVPLGPALRNLNFEVMRDNSPVNQLTYFQSMGILNEFDPNQISHIPNYKDKRLSLAERGRAYMDMNCAHCHNPGAWRRPARRDFDFRYETALENTNIPATIEQIKEQVQEGEMPFLGITVIDQEGVDLIVDYLNSL